MARAVAANNTRRTHSRDIGDLHPTSGPAPLCCAEACLTAAHTVGVVTIFWACLSHLTRLLVLTEPAKRICFALAPV